MKIISLATCSLLVFAATASAESPCHEKSEAKFDAHKALVQCVGSLGGNSTEDCSSKLNSFLETAKGYKTCRIEEEKKEVRKQCGEQRDANQAAHKAFRECVALWNEDTTAHDADPSDRCSTQLGTLVKTEKALSMCRKTGTPKAATPKPKK